MIIYVIIRIINFIANLLVLIIFIDSLLSFFLPPYQPVRRILDRIVNPMLGPIRRVVPPLGGFDLSPLILIILIIVLSNLLIRVLSSI